VAGGPHWRGGAAEPDRGCAEPNRETPVISLLAPLLLIGGLVLLTYVVSTYGLTERIRHDQHRATKREGDRTMADEVAGTVPAQVMRWVEAGPTVLDSVRGMLREHTKLKMIVEATQDECERLRHQDAQLRAEIRRLTAEAERVHKERAESAQWFAAMMNEASGRLRGEHSPAGSGGHQ
jgi:hypothetical protein